MILTSLTRSQRGAHRRDGALWLYFTVLASHALIVSRTLFLFLKFSVKKVRLLFGESLFLTWLGTVAFGTASAHLSSAIFSPFIRNWRPNCLMYPVSRTESG